MIQVYHMKFARSVRVLWLMDEMGLDYERIDLTRGETGVGGPEFEKVHPFKKVPAIVDGDVTMYESVAIMQYIMGKYGPTDLDVPVDDPEFAAYLQWLHFGEATLAPAVTMMMGHLFLLPEQHRIPAMAVWGEREVKKWDKLLAEKIGDKDCILERGFSAADISVTYNLLLLKLLKKHDILSDTTRDYWSRMIARPAWKSSTS